MPDLGSAVVAPHGDARHLSTYVHLGGSVTETVTGLKTFDSITKHVAGTSSAPGLAFTAETALGLYRVSAGELGAAATAGLTIANGASGSYARLWRDGTVGGALGLGLNGTLDAFLHREAAAYLLQRNGTTAQRLGVARTYTDATNYEVGETGWSGTTFRVGTSHAGTGAARTLALMAGGSERWRIDGTDGHLTSVAGTEWIKFGTTAIHAALRSNGVDGTLFVRLADDSGAAPLNVGHLQVGGIIEVDDITSVHGHGIGSSGPWFDGIFTLEPSDAFVGTHVLNVKGAITGTLSASLYGAAVTTDFSTWSSGTHPRAVGVYSAPTITSGGAGVTDGAAIWAIAPPSGATNLYAILADGRVWIGDGGTNAFQAKGLTVSQGTADDQAISLKSSDVAHGATGLADTNAYAWMEKISGANGGLAVIGITEVTMGANLIGYAATPVTTPATTAAAYVQAEGRKYSGTAVTDSATNELIFGVRTRIAGANRTLLLVDADGDLFLDGAAGAAFDRLDDVSLVRAFDLERDPSGLIRSQWDDTVKYHRADLVAAGILTTPGDDAMVNVSQLQRLHNGAIWQLAVRQREAEAELAAVRQELRALRGA